MVAELAGFDEVRSQEDEREGDTEAANDEPQDAQEVILAAHNGECSNNDALLTLVLVCSEV